MNINKNNIINIMIFMVMFDTTHVSTSNKRKKVRERGVLKT